MRARSPLRYTSGNFMRRPADVAQLVQQLIINQQGKGSSPFVSSGGGRGVRRWPRSGGVRHPPRLGKRGVGGRGGGGTGGGGEGGGGRRDTRGGALVGCPSGQREQTVNLPASAYEGSNPSPTTRRAGVAQLVEHQPSKLRVAGSSPVARSRSRSSVGRARPW